MHTSLLHALWPSGLVGDVRLPADQALIGLAWVGVGGVMLAMSLREAD